MPRPIAAMLVMGVFLITTDVVAAAPSDPASFLVAPARNAMLARKLGLAVSLWRGVVALRGEDDPAMLELVRAFTLAGELDAAVDELDRHRRAVAAKGGDTSVLDRQVVELEQRPRGFTGQQFQIVSADAQAREAFRRGRLALKAKRHDEAAALFRAGVEMAPDIPGNHRELGDALARMGRPAEAETAFLRYLRMRPFGKNADELRARLEGSGALGRLTVRSSFDCEQVWMNGQPVPRPLPIEDMVVAPGRYRMLCYSERYHFARYVTAEVPRGGAGRAEFSWAIIENKLDPWGRIVIENPDRESEMNDIGLGDEIGVPVPDDRRSLKVLLRAGDSSRRKDLRIKLEAGKRFPLAW